ncbi:MAG: coproporphyrinogen III oxidase family protein [Deltaproteobacteria bacterium]|nr:MAG: coproporphyrinogen III oxidase family protein [Deltaproteobacteria bacterium]
MKATPPKKVEKEKGGNSFALYIHLPFCRRRCAYCDFVSYAGREGEISPYIEGLLREWEAIKAILLSDGPVEITSCYFGGGTPSLLNEDQVEVLVSGLFPEGVSPGMEFSLEANPESLTPSKLGFYRRLGINRISLGVQSFSDEFLRCLGRVHTTRQAAEAIEMVRKGGWENWSLDLMYGLPGQSPAAFERDLARVLDSGAPHFSAYCLTIAPETPFGVQAAQGRLQLPPERSILEMMDLLEKRASRAGFLHYETSNFSRPGFACVHNLAYWHLEPYIGLGLGAVSYFRDGSAPWGAHWENPTDFEGYAKMAREDAWAFLERTPLTREEALTEAFLTGLRLIHGIEIGPLVARFGGEMVQDVLRKIHPLIEGGWLEMQNGFLRTTSRGSRVLDALLLEIISDLS